MGHNKEQFKQCSIARKNHNCTYYIGLLHGGCMHEHTTTYIHLEIHLFTCKYNTVLHRACTGLVFTLYFDKVSYKPVLLLK